MLILSFLQDFFFPWRLHRLSYFLRYLACGIAAGWLFWGFDGGVLAHRAASILLLVYFMIFVAVPRARDCRLPWWVTLGLFVPIVFFFVGMLLLFKGSRLPAHSSAEPEETGEVAG